MSQGGEGHERRGGNPGKEAAGWVGEGGSRQGRRDGWAQRRELSPGLESRTCGGRKRGWKWALGPVVSL